MTSLSEHRAPESAPPASLLVLLAVACGLTVANLYYAQPLLGVLARAFSVSEGSAALIVTLTQIGYAIGLVLLVPLGDLRENRRLVTTVLAATAAAALAACVAPTYAVFLAASLAVGATSVVAQILVPYAAALAPDRDRGRVVGRVMSGLLLGILLARTLAGLVAATAGWRAVYGGSAVLMLVLALVLSRRLPRRAPPVELGYRALLATLLPLVRQESVLRWRTAYQVLMFGAFSVFWTSIAYELEAVHHLGQAGIGVFALVGAAGAGAAPLAGRLADRGRASAATGAALALAVVSAALAGVGAHSLVLLALAGVLLDFAVQTTLVTGQREIYRIRPEARARMNTVYLATFFAAGALASAASGAAYASGGWPVVTTLAGALPAAGFLAWLLVGRHRVPAPA